MHFRALATLALAALLLGCPKAPEVKRRAVLRNVGGSAVEVVPSEGQLPFCLVFTISEGKRVRQLTMNRDNESVKCDAGQAIGGVSFRIPLEEGKIKLLVFFSDRKLKAGSVAQQIYELTSEGKTFLAYDLRLPGDVKVETLDFEPAEDVPEVSGAVVGQEGAMADGGAAAMAPTESGSFGPAEKLGTGDVIQVIAGQKPQIEECVKAQHAKQPGSSGKLLVQWTILTSGKTSNVAVQSADLKGTPIAQCVSDLVGKLVFPEHKVQGEPVVFPFAF